MGPPPAGSGGAQDPTACAEALRGELALRRQELEGVDAELARAEADARRAREAAEVVEERLLVEATDSAEASAQGAGGDGAGGKSPLVAELEARLAQKEAERAELQGRAGRRDGEDQVPRAVLVRQVNELVGNIRKQGAEIDKVHRESQDVRREINAAAEVVGRAYALADQSLYASARRYPEAREAYKMLVALHEGVAEVSRWRRERGASVAALATLTTGGGG